MPKVRFDELLDAFEFVSFGSPYEHCALISRTTGKVHFQSEMLEDEDELPEDIDNAENYIPIPHKTELDLGRKLVEKFCAEELTEADEARVRSYFKRQGAYSRFKSLLEERQLLEKWYAFERDATEQSLREWAEELNIELVEGSEPAA